MNDRYDALVIGGGPAGSAAAGLLARSGWSVLLVEREAFPRRKVCGEYLSGTNWPLLERLGLGGAFARMAGPDVRRVALFCGKDRVTADLPRPRNFQQPWGRALSRQRLDAWLLAEASEAGVEVRQPEQVEEVVGDARAFACRVAPSQAADRGKRAARRVWAAVVIAANGSWTSSPLDGQTRPRPRAGDLFGFKAHFLRAGLPSGLMPLVSFPGGYGGMVECEGGQVSLSCCVRRDCLGRLPRRAGQSAGEALLVYLLNTCPALRDVLEPAVIDGPWLSAGPIRPGVRACYEHGIFRAGNAAGEAHPVVAEGISMALQSAWLLAEDLIAAGRPGRRSFDNHHAVGRSYRAAWRQAFAPRIRAAAAVAHWAMRPAAVRCVLPLVQRFPQLLTWGACQSGKVTMVVPATESSIE